MVSSFNSFSSSFSSLIKSKAGRNNTGRTTVRYRSRPKFPAFFSPKTFYSQSKNTFVAPSYKFRTLPDAFFSASKVVGSLRKLSAAKYTLSFLPLHVTPPNIRVFSYGSFLSSGFSLTRMYTIPYGSRISYLQWSSNGRPVFARAPGCTAQLIKRRGSFVVVKLPSGEIRKFAAVRFASVNNSDVRILRRPVYYKAGQIRNLGTRPHVRGCAINPVDHPHGGRTGESRPSVTPWGLLTKGKKTRHRPYSSRVVLKSVQQLKVTNLFICFLMSIRDLKKAYSHIFFHFRPTVKNYSSNFSLPFELAAERVYYYSGNSFKSLLFKENLAGQHLFFFRRIKLTGKSIHTRKKKKKK